MDYLHVDSIFKNYSERQILTDVYLSCKQGEIIGLLGRNGCGKSTMLKIIFGGLTADNKFIKVGDKLINNVFDSRNLIKFLPQDSFLPNHLRVRNIISLFCNKEQAEILRKHKTIKPLLHRKSKFLSGGEKRILEIYLIIHSNANYVLIDEPFNGVSPVYKEEIKSAIIEQSKHKGFIITDHDYRNIVDVSTRILFLHDGGIKNIKDSKELERWGYVNQ